MKQYQILLSLIFIFCISGNSAAQDSLVSYHLKKGEVLDFLFLTTKPDTKDTMKEYRENAFPVAIEKGYSFLPGFKILETTQGNYQPQGLVFGKWKSLQKREEFLAEIDERVPNFHDMRRTIWSLFGLTYYEMQEDISLELDLSKVVVATAYWKEGGNQKRFDAFIVQWNKSLEKSGGTLKGTFTEGNSPFGYDYNPDYMVLSQWDRQEDFQAFLIETRKLDTVGLKNVHQFILGK